MGNDQAKQRAAPAPQPPPYTSFSRSKDGAQAAGGGRSAAALAAAAGGGSVGAAGGERGAGSSAAGAGAASPAQGDTGIITVAQTDAQQSSEPELVALHSLPQFTPLIRGSASDNLRDAFSPPRTGSLDRMDPKAALTLCLDYQSFYRHWARRISSEQLALGNKMKHTETNAGKALYFLSVQNNDLKAFVAHMKEVERIQNSIAQTQTLVQEILAQTESLRQLLPEDESMAPFVETLRSAPPAQPAKDASLVPE